MVRAPLVPVCFAFLLGILLAARLPLPLSLTLTGICIGAAVASHRRPVIAQWLLLLAVAGLGTARMSATCRLPAHHIARVATEAPRHVTLRGIVQSDPVTAPTPFGDTSVSAIIAVQALNDRAAWRTTTGLARATILHPSVALQYGDEITLQGTLREPPAPGNPGMFDYRAFLARQGVRALLRVSRRDDVVVVRHHQGRWLTRIAYRWRARLIALIRRYLPPQDAGMLAALLVGDRSDLSPDLTDAFILTGTMHIIAISGFNVGLLAMCALWLLRVCWAPRRWRIAATMALLGLFMVMTGGHAPVVRATVMAWVVLGGMLLSRAGAITNSLALAALLILAWSPHQLGDPGFQLSFAAVIALVTIAPRVMAAIERTRRGAAFTSTRVRRYAVELAVATLAATLGVAPLVLHHFGVISPIGLVANLLVVPLASLLVIGGLGFLLLAHLMGILAAGAGWWLAQLLHVWVAVTMWCARVPGGGWYVAPLPWWGVALLYACGLLAWYRRELKLPEARLMLVWLLLFNGWVWARALTPAAHELRVTALDVGHGDAILVECPERGRFLIDGGAGGAYDQGRRVIAPYLRSRGIRRLDAVVVMHPDSDHVGGLASVLASFDVGAVLENGDEKPTAAFAQYRAIVARKHIPRFVVARGDRVLGFPDVNIEVVHPGHDAALHGNDRSLIVRLRHGATTFLFTGDADEAGLASLLMHEPHLRADVLKVPHHGSALGPLTERFFAQLDPSIAIISMTVHAATPLPHPLTLAALDRAGVECYLTGRDGAVTITSDGRQVHVAAHRRAASR